MINIHVLEACIQKHVLDRFLKQKQTGLLRVTQKSVFDVMGEKDIVTGKGALRAGARSAILVSCFSRTESPRPSDTFPPATVCLCNAHHCVQMLGTHQSCLTSNTI